MLARLFARFAQQGTPRVVVDTNILVSGTIVRHGPSAAVLDAAQQKRIVLVVSSAILSEYLEAIQRPHIAKRYKRIESRIATLTRFLQDGSIVVTPQTVVRVVPSNPDDDFVIACAVDGRANYIVSGDQHFLKLGRYRGIKILSPREFVTAVLE